MEKLFTYGTLQDPHVQEELFHHTLSGTPDVLRGYRKDTVATDGNEFNAASLDRTSTIDGMVYDLSHDELIRADQYEGKLYVRTPRRLRSGIVAWVYLKA